MIGGSLRSSNHPLFDDDSEYFIGENEILDQPHVSMRLMNIEA